MNWLYIEAGNFSGGVMVSICIFASWEFWFEVLSQMTLALSNWGIMYTAACLNPVAVGK